MRGKDKILEQVEKANDIVNQHPIIKGLVAGGLSLLPFFGEAITTTIDSWAAKRAEDNSRRLCDELRVMVKQVSEDSIDIDYIGSDEFSSLILEILAKNARVHETEKTNLFASILINSAKVEFSSELYKEGFIRVIDELSMLHIRILSFIANNDSRFTQEDRINHRDYVTSQQVSESVGLNVDQIAAFSEQMVRYGLLKDHSLGNWIVGHQPGTSYEMTIYGRKFIQFLKSSKSREQNE